MKAIGFIVSFTACALVLAFIDFELHYDAWNPNADRIARAVETRSARTGAESTSLPYAFADAALEGLPGLQYAARVQPIRAMLQRGQDRFNELVFFVEPSFLKIFPVSILSGSRQPLEQPYSIVISERAAKKYFGTENPVGKTLLIGGARELSVSAVMRNWPSDSHIQPDFLIPLNTFFSLVASGESHISKASITGWSNCHCYVTYLLFDSPSSLPSAQEAVQPLLVSQQGAAYAARFPITLQPLRDVYLGSAQVASYLDHAAKGDPMQLTVFGALAAVLLLISGLSFANFFTAQATAHAKEFAVRRILGAKPRAIVARLTAYAVVVAFAAAVAGLCLAADLMAPFGRFVNRPLRADVLLHASFIAQLLGIAFGVGLLSGLGTGLFMARVHARALLQGRLGRGHSSGARFRRVLVGLQFVFACVLIVLVLGISAELSFVRERSLLGFDPRGLLVLNAEGTAAAAGSASALKELEARLAALPRVGSVSIANTVPTTPLVNRVSVERQGSRDGEARTMFLNAVDFNFMKTLHVRVLAGRDFDPAFGGDRLELGRYVDPAASGGSPASVGSAAPDDHPVIDAIINRAAARELGFGSSGDKLRRALGQTLTFPGNAYPFALRIVGVADDVRYGGPREVVDPVVYVARTDWQINLHQQSYLLISAGGNERMLARQIVRIWDELVPEFVGDVSLMEDRIARQTRDEHREMQLVSVFTATALLLLVLGILGFAAFSMNRQARGLAIRRVFGASRAEIAMLIASAELRIVASAVAIACPLAWLTIAWWLRGFAVRAPISASWFLVGCLAVAGISFMALLAFTFRLTAVGPARYLRSE